MPKLFRADAILTSFAVVLVNMGRPSLALQLQKQTETDARGLLTYERQGSRVTDTIWLFGEVGQSCDDACKSECGTAACEPLKRLEISSGDIMQDLLEKEVKDNPCTSVATLTVPQGPLVGTYGDCYAKRFGEEHAYDECSSTSANDERSLCACEVALGACSISEDPHINVFDDSQISLLLVENTEAVSEAAGEKWLVNSASVQVQAKFEKVGNISLRDSNLFTRAVAIGGEILNGNVMVIGSLDDPITWNGQPILLEDNSSFYLKETKVFVNATRGSSSLVQDLSKDNLGVNVRLRSGVSMVVNRLHHYLNVAIQMPPQAGGQEGLCGNFNGFGADDSLEMTSSRLDPNVLPGASLFAGTSFH